MAQYRGQFNAERHWSEYWKIQPMGEWSKKDYHKFLTSMRYRIPHDGHRLLELAHRCLEGREYYGWFSHSKLSTLCSKRRLVTGVARRYNHVLGRMTASKAVMIQALENDDDKKSRFSRFLDLPPELRLRIYELHYQWLNRDKHIIHIHGVRPPITSVSKLVRKESLPLFYQNITFHMRIEDDGTGMDIDKASEKLYYQMPARLLRTIRRLYIEAITYGPSKKKHRTICLYLLCETNQAVDFIFVDKEDGATLSELNSYQEVVEPHLQALVDAMNARANRGLVRADLSALVKAFEALEESSDESSDEG